MANVKLTPKQAEWYLKEKDVRNIYSKVDDLISRNPDGTVTLDVSKDTRRFVEVTPQQAQALKAMGDRQQKLLQTDEGKFVLDTTGSIYANDAHDVFTDRLQHVGAFLAIGTIGLGAPLGVPFWVAGARMERNNADQVSIYTAIHEGGKDREVALGHLEKKMDILGDV